MYERRVMGASFGSGAELALPDVCSQASLGAFPDLRTLCVGNLIVEGDLGMKLGSRGPMELVTRT